jgi:hypothetical protein
LFLETTIKVGKPSRFHRANGSPPIILVTHKEITVPWVTIMIFALLCMSITPSTAAEKRNNASSAVSLPKTYLEG